MGLKPFEPPSEGLIVEWPVPSGMGCGSRCAISCVLFAFLLCVAGIHPYHTSNITSLHVSSHPVVVDVDQVKMAHSIRNSMMDSDDVGDVDTKDASLSIVVLGASGDLAQKKTYPTLLALYKKGLLPQNTNIFGYARSKMSDEQFREKIGKGLKDDKDAEKNKAKGEFLQRCFYVVGGYDDVEHFKKLHQELLSKEESFKTKNRVSE